MSTNAVVMQFSEVFQSFEDEPAGKCQRLRRLSFRTETDCQQKDFSSRWYAERYLDPSQSPGNTPSEPPLQHLNAALPSTEEMITALDPGTQAQILQKIVDTDRTNYSRSLLLEAYCSCSKIEQPRIMTFDHHVEEVRELLRSSRAVELHPSQLAAAIKNVTDRLVACVESILRDVTPHHPAATKFVAIRALNDIGDAVFIPTNSQLQKEVQRLLQPSACITGAIRHLLKSNGNERSQQKGISGPQDTSRVVSSQTTDSASSTEPPEMDSVSETTDTPDETRVRARLEDAIALMLPTVTGDWPTIVNHVEIMDIMADAAADAYHLTEQERDCVFNDFVDQCFARCGAHRGEYMRVVTQNIRASIARTAAQHETPGSAMPEPAFEQSMWAMISSQYLA